MVSIFGLFAGLGLISSAWSGDLNFWGRRLQIPNECSCGLQLDIQKINAGIAIPNILSLMGPKTAICISR